MRVDDYATNVNPTGKLGFPNLGKNRETGGVPSRMRQGTSSMNMTKDASGRDTPKQSSMNVRDPMPVSGNRNTNPNGSGGFFMTQPDIGSSTMVSPAAPRTGASAFRKNNMAPLLTHGHQRMVSTNISQA